MGLGGLWSTDFHSMRCRDLLKLQSEDYNVGVMMWPHDPHFRIFAMYTKKKNTENTC